jgi:hypothetical protein
MSEPRWIGGQPTLPLPRPKARRPKPSRVGRGLACALITIAIAACGSSAGHATPIRTASPSPSPSATPAETLSPAATATSSATPAATASMTPAPTQPKASPSPIGHFSVTGSMGTPRSGHSATLLQDGRVLITGGVAEGVGGPGLKSAELYDPTTGKFTPTGSMTVARDVHAAILLHDGRVLVVGGYSWDFAAGHLPLASAELYDPASGIFSPTGSMGTARAYFAAVELKDGRVLVAGGQECTYAALAVCDDLSSAELYDPASGTFSPTGSMVTARAPGSATLLADGRVLVIGGGSIGGGLNPASAELYDPSTGKFSATGSMGTARSGYSATLLRDGRVLVAGGETSPASATSAELYSPSTGRFSPAGSMISPHFLQTATLLSDGRVLVAGGGQGKWCTMTGCSPGVDFRLAELYDPATGGFAAARPMNGGRSRHTATLLQDGRVLMVGGENDLDASLASAELFGL